MSSSHCKGPHAIARDEGRHFGLVVDDKDAVRKALTDAGTQPLPGTFLDFLDPWGNRIEIVGQWRTAFHIATAYLACLQATSHTFWRDNNPPPLCISFERVGKVLGSVYDFDFERGDEIWLKS